MPTDYKYEKRTSTYKPYNDARTYGNISSAPKLPYTYPNANPKKVSRPPAKQTVDIQDIIIRNKKSVFKLIVGLAVLMLLCLTMVFRFSVILTQNQNIKELEKDYNDLLASNQAMQAQIDKQLEIDEIEKYAKENLGMMKAQSYQTYYVNMQMEDSGSVGTIGKGQPNTVVGIPGTLMNAFRVLK